MLIFNDVVFELNSLFLLAGILALLSCCCVNDKNASDNYFVELLKLLADVSRQSLGKMKLPLFGKEGDGEIFRDYK